MITTTLRSILVISLLVGCVSTPSPMPSPSMGLIVPVRESLSESDVRTILIKMLEGATAVTAFTKGEFIYTTTEENLDIANYYIDNGKLKNLSRMGAEKRIHGIMEPSVKISILRVKDFKVSFQFLDAGSVFWTNIYYLNFKKTISVDKFHLITGTTRQGKYPVTFSQEDLDLFYYYYRNNYHEGNQRLINEGRLLNTIPDVEVVILQIKDNDVQLKGINHPEIYWTHIDAITFNKFIKFKPTESDNQITGPFVGYTHQISEAWDEQRKQLRNFQTARVDKINYYATTEEDIDMLISLTKTQDMDGIVQMSNDGKIRLLYNDKKCNVLKVYNEKVMFHYPELPAIIVWALKRSVYIPALNQ